ncbi:MAG: hypothetical protein IKL65_04745 [Bacilli bacterium]|nr:hypothetical protein [Bacilli bacterium]
MEKKTEKEILAYLKEVLVKGSTVENLCKELEISDFALYGYISKLKEQEIIVKVYEKSDKIEIKINNNPDLSKQYTYKIEEDLDSKTKIGVISDLRFGSKYEQISKLNDMYRKFAEDGVKYVLITGNLLEGKYTARKEEMFGNSLLFNTGIAQADHLIEYFPKVEGIKTLFITGETDHTWKDFNVGKYIESKRSDMTYLGPKSCNIKFNNISVQVENLKKNGEAYTIAYPPQKYSRSLACYEDYDIILLGGTLTIQDFPRLRDSRILTIPSCVARTPLMKSKDQQNTMGSYELELSYNKIGKLKNLNANASLYYLPSEENYLTIKPLNIKHGQDDELIEITNKKLGGSELFLRLDKIYKVIKKEEKFSDLKNRLNVTDNELFGIIDMLQQYGREIEIIDVNNELVVRKTFQKRKNYEVKPRKEELTKKEFLVISDTHYGSIWCQPSMVNTAVYEAYNRGITDVFHVGDITDGDYSRIRPNHVHEVFLYGATGQMEYVVKNLPKYKGIKYHAIAGSHDQTHLFNYGMVLGEEVAKRRPDFEYLGQDRAFYYFDNCKMEVFHPGGGTSRILSSKPQNGIDQIPSNTKPKISLRGHYHKIYIGSIRNILTLLCGCNVDQSSFMMKNEIPNLMCNYFVSIWYDKNGDIQYFEVNPMVFDEKDVRKNDWENPRKCIKNKILTIKN